jgi:4'-phosphopantetheinyl transferase
MGKSPDCISYAAEGNGFFMSRMLMNIAWMEQSENDVPAENQWLSPKELICLDRLRFAKRRADWRLGRWTAKQALAACMNLPADAASFANIELRATSSGAPEIFLRDQPAPLGISLSHRAGIALCAVGPREASFGCDVETVEPRSAAFVADYFTGEERTLIERAPVEHQPELVTLLWSAKESALKALRVGLRLDTRCVFVSPAGLTPQPGSVVFQDPLPELIAGQDGWCPLLVRYASRQFFCGWWRLKDELLRTIVSEHSMTIPIRLRQVH